MIIPYNIYTIQETIKWLEAKLVDIHRDEKMVTDSIIHLKEFQSLTNQSQESPYTTAEEVKIGGANRITLKCNCGGSPHEKWCNFCCSDCGHSKDEHPIRGVSGNMICQAFNYYRPQTKKGCKQFYDFNSKVCGVDGLCEDCRNSTNSALNSQEIDVVGKPMKPSTPNTSGNVTSVTPDNIHQQNKKLLDKDYEIREDFKLYAKDKLNEKENKYE